LGFSPSAAWRARRSVDEIAAPPLATTPFYNYRLLTRTISHVGKIVMKTELRLTVAAIAATLPLLCANASQIIPFGPSLPAGTVPDGYAGFNWHGAQNDVFADTTSSFFGSAFITEMSGTAAFDLDSMVIQNLNSDTPSGGDTTAYKTVVSGFLNGALVESVTENYGFGGGTVLPINMDGVNDIKFTTTEITTRFGQPGVFTSPDFTLVSQMTVDKFSPVTKAPEMDPATAASALTLMLGSLLVFSGRRARRLAVSA
jgi:hypothetical protein